MDNINNNDRLYTTLCSERTLQTDTNGFFFEFADHVVNFSGLDWLENTFGKLKNDRERILSLLNDEHVKEIVCDTLKNVQCIYRKKDAKISRDKREEAHIYLKTGILPKALILYCQSVLRAPPKGVDLLVDAGRTLSLALWGRSQVLAQLGEIKIALNDLQLAIKEGLPDRLRPELYVFMAACYTSLGELNRAKVALSLSEKLYGKNKDTFQKIKQSIKLKASSEKINRKFLPEVTDGHNEIHESASSLLELKESIDLGRYFVAKKHISTGDTLVVEAPRAACLLPKNFGSHCHHCFIRLMAPVGCPDCVAIAFCSIECRDKAITTYHKFECKILDMLIGSGMSILCHIALRLITQEGLKNCLELLKNKSLDPAQQLCKHDNQREPKDFLQRSLMAVFLLRCLQKSGFFPDKIGSDEMVLCEEELQISELLLFNLQMLQFNAHEIYETKHTAEHRFRHSKTGYVGVGIYTTISLFNHDCYPGVLRYYVDRNMVIKANRPFKPGDVIPENYGPVFLMKSLAERQRSLLSRYWFKCHCTACTEDWPALDKLQNRHARLKCTTKDCNYLFPQSTPDLINCTKCKKKISLKSSKEILESCENQYKIGFNLVDAEQPEKAIPILIKAINTFHSIAVPPHRETHLAQEALRTSFADTGNVYQCLVIT